MKKFAFLLLAIASSFAAMSQNSTSSNPAEMQIAKEKEMAMRLNLTDEQEAKFIPIYKEFARECDAVNSQKDKIKQMPKSTSEEAAQRINAKLDIKKQVIDVQKKYIVKLSSVLNAKQLNEFLKTEKYIQNRLKQRSDKAKHGNAK